MAPEMARDRPAAAPQTRYRDVRRAVRRLRSSLHDELPCGWATAQPRLLAHTRAKRRWQYPAAISAHLYTLMGTCIYGGRYQHEATTHVKGPWRRPGQHAERSPETNQLHRLTDTAAERPDRQMSQVRPSRHGETRRDETRPDQSRPEAVRRPPS